MKHANECHLDSTLYRYTYAAKRIELLFNCVYKVIEAKFDGQVYHPDALDAHQKVVKSMHMDLIFFLLLAVGLSQIGHRLFLFLLKGLWLLLVDYLYWDGCTLCSPLHSLTQIIPCQALVDELKQLAFLNKNELVLVHGSSAAPPLASSTTSLSIPFLGNLDTHHDGLSVIDQGMRAT